MDYHDGRIQKWQVSWNILTAAHSSPVGTGSMFCFAGATHLFTVSDVERIMVLKLLSSKTYNRASMFLFNSEIRVKFVSLCWQKHLL